MEPDNPVRWGYEVTDEDARLRRPGIGDLVRLRTWEILERVIPSPGRVLDVGGGPGRRPFHGRVGDALELAADDDSVDAVVMLGPLYHLVDRSDRVAALREAHRVLQPGGVLVAEVMTRHSWLLDTALKEKWGAPEEWERLEASLTSGRSLGAEAEVPEKLLRAIRLSESDPSMLGVSAHVMGVANRH